MLSGRVWSHNLVRQVKIIHPRWSNAISIPTIIRTCLITVLWCASFYLLESVWFGSVQPVSIQKIGCCLVSDCGELSWILWCRYIYESILHPILVRRNHKPVFSVLTPTMETQLDLILWIHEFGTPLDIFVSVKFFWFPAIKCVFMMQIVDECLDCYFFVCSVMDLDFDLHSISSRSLLRQHIFWYWI